jgi:integrase
MGRLGQALASLSPDNKAAAVLRLLIFTGARKTEIEGLRWDAVDFERRCLRLADSKTGPKVIPVGVPAIAILEEIKHAEGSPFVFPAEGDLNRHFVGTPRVWVRVRSTAGIAGVRLHDLRHTYASLAVGSGQSLPLIGKLLGHRDVKTTAQYAHIADHPVAAAANTTAQAAARALAGK